MPARLDDSLSSNDRGAQVVPLSGPWISEAPFRSLICLRWVSLRLRAFLDSAPSILAPEMADADANEDDADASGIVAGIIGLLDDDDDDDERKAAGDGLENTTESGVPSAENWASSSSDRFLAAQASAAPAAGVAPPPPPGLAAPPPGLVAPPPGLGSPHLS